MFSRRHPYLFFILVFTLILCSSSVIISLVSGVSKISEKKTGKYNIGVIDINGIIFESESVIENLKNFRERKDIEAVVLRINSPGGGVAPSQEIYESVKRLKQKKKVVASLGSVAASGGYYIASAADKIVTNPGTITGSIGVIMEYTNIEEVMDKIGVSPVVIKSGKFKDTGSPTRPITDDEKKFLQDFVDKIHSQFVEDVASGRKMDKEKVMEYADGRIISGSDAVLYGLADMTGNFETALDYTALEAGIKKNDYNLVYPPKEKFSFLREVLSESVSKLSEVVFKNTNLMTLK
ncbi:MAG: signal peptide peptidase SppA [Desulforegulaceae bacterium]|nr:signal peptide peptidase SppA [Desulforegulaceae bacterium]